MTIKLYDLDAYQTTFEATVLSCTKREKDYDVILDQTLFFPEEGGQTCDQGTLNDVKVHDVQIIDQEIHHYVNDPLKGKIIGKIDFKHRYTNSKIIVVNIFYQDSLRKCLVLIIVDFI